MCLKNVISDKVSGNTLNGHKLIMSCSSNVIGSSPGDLVGTPRLLHYVLQNLCERFNACLRKPILMYS